MIRFAFPQFLYLLVLVPLQMAFYVWFVRRRRERLRAAGDPELLARLLALHSEKKLHWKIRLSVLAAALLAMALAGPEIGTKYEQVKIEGVDIVVALDISTSMNAQDIKPSRLERSKHLIGTLLNLLQGDRVGLVIFAGDGFVQCPLTTDYGAVRMFLDAIESDATTSAGTNLEAALEKAGEAFTERTTDGTTSHGRAVVLFSDGEDHGSDYAGQAEQLAARGIRVYTAGVASETGAPIPVLDGGGQVVDFKKVGGSVVTTRLESGPLKEVAEKTGGSFYSVSAYGREINKIHEAIAGLQKGETAQYQFTEYENRYQLILLTGLVLIAVAFLVNEKKGGTA
jgi:Ca-activated chloride channel family protein